jgi:hypothetical protein
MMEGFLDLHKGYNLRAVLVEAFGMDELAFYTAGDFFRRWDDYSSWYIRSGEAIPPLPVRPYLVGITREEAHSMGLHPLLPIFVHAPPRCFFDNRDQQILREALRGRTDEELAIELRVSLSTIKKRWMQIFEAVDGIIPELTLSVISRPPADHRRGAQRRHLVLRYVRAHPEELAPYAPSEPKR